MRDKFEVQNFGLAVLLVLFNYPLMKPDGSLKALEKSLLHHSRLLIFKISSFLSETLEIQVLIVCPEA